jgi:hypothetical protein
MVGGDLDGGCAHASGELPLGIGRDPADLLGATAHDME